VCIILSSDEVEERGSTAGLTEWIFETIRVKSGAPQHMPTSVVPINIAPCFNGLAESIPSALNGAGSQLTRTSIKVSNYNESYVQR